MWIKKKEIEQLSEFVKGYSSGEELDIRVNREGSFNILKNDIYALVNTKNEQIKAVETERDSLSDYMADISHQLKTPITSMMIMITMTIMITMRMLLLSMMFRMLHNSTMVLTGMKTIIMTAIRMTLIQMIT